MASMPEMLFKKRKIICDGAQICHTAHKCGLIQSVSINNWARGNALHKKWILLCTEMDISFNSYVSADNEHATRSISSTDELCGNCKGRRSNREEEGQYKSKLELNFTKEKAA